MCVVAAIEASWRIIGRPVLSGVYHLVAMFGVLSLSCSPSVGVPFFFLLFTSVSVCVVPFFFGCNMLASHDGQIQSLLLIVI